MESFLPKRNPLVRKRVWIAMGIFCVLIAAWNRFHKGENYWVTLVPGIFLTPGETGRYDVLISSTVYADIPDYPKGGSVAVTDVKDVAVVPNRFICGSFINSTTRLPNWFLIDLRVKQSEIDSETFNSSSQLSSKLKDSFQTSTPTFKDVHEW